MVGRLLVALLGVLVLLCVPLALVGQGIDEVRAWSGRSGAVTVDECRWVPGNQYWKCYGEFVSDDGSLVIEDIELYGGWSERPQDPVPAQVSGESAVVARKPFGWDGVLILAFVIGVFVYLVVAWLRAVFERDAPEPSVRSRLPESFPVPLRPLEATPMSPTPVACPVPPSGESPPAAPSESATMRLQAPSVRRIDASVELPRTGPLPRNPVMTVVVAWCLLLSAAVAAMAVTVLSSEDPATSLSEIASARVVAVGLGGTQQVRMDWTDHTGQHWQTTLTPREAGSVAVGDTVELRYHPDRPHDPYPVSTVAFEEAFTFQRNEPWAVTILVPASGLLCVWLWRLAHWASVVRRPGRPVRVRVVAGTARDLGVGPGLPADRPPYALWLEIRDQRGDIWQQRVVWHRRLVAFAVAESEQHRARVYSDRTESEGRPNAIARRCPCQRPMFVIDIPYVGRLWPAGRARRSEPFHTRMGDFAAEKVGDRSHLAAALAGLVVLGPTVVFLMVGIAGPVAAASVPVVFGSLWLLLGGGPIGGVYSYRPRESHLRQVRQGLVGHGADC
jgi:hypothetical protein